MDWNCNPRPPFVSPIFSSEMMKHSIHEAMLMGNNYEMNYNNQEKKKRLTSEQVESLESSFQEQIKLDPDRKMKLAMELGMQPRQIAVWFQNRRARWKTKQLEQLYQSLKEDYHVVSREKQRLQEEVVALRCMIKGQDGKKPVSTGYTEISGEETVESTSMACSGNHQMPECSYVFNVDDYNGVMPPAYWGGLPTTYQS